MYCTYINILFVIVPSSTSTILSTITTTTADITPQPSTNATVIATVMATADDETGV